MRRLLTVVMIAVLALPLFAGGGAESTAGAPDEIRKITFPLAEPVEIRIATPDGTSASLANSLPVWQEIERLTNVRIVWDAIPSTQYNEVMKLRVSAGTSALPDIMMVPNGLSVAELGQQGIIIPLQDQLAVNGQDILRVYDELPMVRATTTTDGNIYTINSAGNGIQTPYSLIIRQDWLDKLGEENPAWPQYLVTGKGQEQVANDYNIRSIPRFMLFDAQGRIITVDAPRPSTPDIKAILEELIK